MLIKCCAVIVECDNQNLIEDIMSNSMPTPTPTPRQKIAAKKPIPAPRTLIPIRPIKEETTDEPDAEEITKPAETGVNTNTFSRRVRTLSNEIGGKVQEGKKAVIESTRQSVRKITRRFSSNLQEQSNDNLSSSTSSEPQDESIEKVFSNIRFNSPINQYSSDSESVYTNVTINNNIGEDSSPPPYPPPPLPNDVYDNPHSQSVTSGSTNSSEEMVRPQIRRNPQDYESVFPSYPYNSDSESCVDMTAGTIDRKVETTRCDSWKFYDPLPGGEEPVYNNVDSTPALSVTTSSERSFMRANSLYENHEITVPPNRPSQSVLMEFDPLNESGSTINQAQELSELEKLLQGELYGNMNFDCGSTMLDDNDNSEIDETEYISPPPPPERIDSLPDVPCSPEKSATDSPSATRRSTWFTNFNNNAGDPQKNRSSKWTKFNDVLKKAPELVKGLTRKESFVTRPMISPKGSIIKKGMLYKITNGPVDDLFGEYVGRWCVLQSGVFICYTDTSCDTVKENVPASSILSIQIKNGIKYRDEEELFGFELITADKVRRAYIFGTKSMPERREWMQNLAESLTSHFGSKITSDYQRLGWAYMREGLSSQWTGTWLCLSKRRLYYIVDNSSLKYLDLRKARYFELETRLQGSNPPTADKGPNLAIHFTSGTFYFRMWTQKETKIWCRTLKRSACNNRPNLSQQQLTKNDVPVIVEKCINFVFAYGSMSEGIYRKAGSNNAVASLMNQFREDAWSMQLTNKYSVNDVATALKRFFRELAEPLIDSNKRQYIYQVTLVKNKEEKIRMFKAVFDQVNKVQYNTSKCLLLHLHFISTQSDKNLMNIQNLASVWGPSLLQNDNEEDTDKNRVIVAHLIEFAKYIFPQDSKQIEQEQKMLSVLQKCASSPEGAVNIKSSGDFRVWVYLENKEGQTFNVLVGPQKTACDILIELSAKIKKPVDELILEEVVLDNNLCRPIHYTEKVLDVILKWSYWDNVDGKGNCLIITNLSKYKEFMLENNLPLSAEVRFADSKTKQIKPYIFEFQQAKLTCYKDKSCTVKMNSWNIEEIIWYFGNEPKRNNPSKYTLTFISKKESPKRTKGIQFFGNVMCWNDPSLRALWIAAMWHAEYPKGIAAPAQHVNLLSS